MSGCASRAILRLLGAGALLLAALLWTAPASGQPRATEAQVKAVFLFKFSGYVEWPPQAFATPDAPFAIGVVEAAPLARELTTLVAGRRVAGRPVVVRELRRDQAMSGLQMLFIGHAAREDVKRTLEPLRDGTTLVVTETDGALSLGSTINFVLIDGKVRFDIAPPPPHAGGLRISSRLLAVARDVKDPS